LPERQIIISCEHGGHEVPEPYAALFHDHATLLASHRGWDPGALALAEALVARLEAPLFSTTVSRLLIDHNRSLSHPALFSEISRALSDPDRERLIDHYYLPHRQKVLDAVSRAIGSGRQVLHLAIHSFTPVLAGKVRRADLGLLYDPARRHERQLCQGWQAAIKKACPDLTIRRNYPYRGQSDGLATWLRGRFQPADYLGIEVELNQARLAAGEQGRIAELLARTLSSCLAISLAGSNQPCPISTLHYDQSPLPPGGEGLGWGGAATTAGSILSQNPNDTGDPSQEVVAIVDAENRVIGQATRREMRRRNLIHRATYILVFNQKEQLFVQKRTQSKDIYPGYFDVAAGGVVLSGEDYEESAQRELHEELGLTAELEFLFDRYFEDDRNKVWGRVYRCRHEGPFVLQESEVESGAFMMPAEILAAEKERADFTPDGLAILEQLISAGGRDYCPPPGSSSVHRVRRRGRR